MIGQFRGFRKPRPNPCRWISSSVAAKNATKMLKTAQKSQLLRLAFF
jgi:hypothetical protein